MLEEPDVVTQEQSDPRGVAGEQGQPGGVRFGQLDLPGQALDGPHGDRLELGFGRRRRAVGRHRRP